MQRFSIPALFLLTACGESSPSTAKTDESSESSTAAATSTDSSTSGSGSGNKTTAGGTTEAPDVESSNSTSDGSESTGEPARDPFVNVYIADDAEIGPVGLGGTIQLRARASAVAILSDGDYVVFGEEQVSAAGVIAYYPTLYRFSGIDGSFEWKNIDPYMAEFATRGLLGVGTNDTIYVVGQAGPREPPRLRAYDPEGSILWTSDDETAEQVRARLRELAPSGNLTPQPGAVTPDGTIVVPVKAGDHVGTLIYDENGTFQSMAAIPYPFTSRPVKTAPDRILQLAAVHFLDQDTQINLIDIQPSTNTIDTLQLDLSSHGQVPMGNEAARTWEIVSLVHDGDELLLALLWESFGDPQNDTTHHMFRLDATGTIIDHMIVEIDTSAALGTPIYPSVKSLAITPVGYVLVGHYRDTLGGTYNVIPVFNTYGFDFSFQGNFTLPGLNDYMLAWQATAARGEQLITVGDIENAAIVMFGTYVIH